METYLIRFSLNNVRNSLDFVRPHIDVYVTFV